MANAAIALEEEGGKLEVTVPSTGKLLKIPYKKPGWLSPVPTILPLAHWGGNGPYDLPKLTSDKAPHKWPAV